MGGKIKKKQIIISSVIISLVMVLTTLMIVVGLANGWFGEEKVTLGEAYYGDFVGYDELSAKDYEELVQKKDSFVVFVDQSGCDSADKLRKYTEDWAKERGIKVFRIMFSEMRETSMHDLVKYYPSLVVVEKGKVKTFLKADSDNDAAKYNDYSAFKSWIEEYI